MWCRLVLLVLSLAFFACNTSNIKEINIGVIVPLSNRSTDLGIAPSNAMQLAVEKYNNSRDEKEPKINLYIKDDQWDGTKALSLYKELRVDYGIDVIFISNTKGMIALQDQIKEDHVVLINPLNSDSLLSSLGGNNFRIAKKTEEANELIALRILELELENVLILQCPNFFMETASNSVQKRLNEAGLKNKIVVTQDDQKNFSSILSEAKSENVDAIVFFGHKNYGHAMKQSRDMGLNAKFFSSTALLDSAFMSNSVGAIMGTEICFFTESDGNFMLANRFVQEYKEKFGERPNAIWPVLQAYDAMNIVIREVRHVNQDEVNEDNIEQWLSDRLLKVRAYPGVCGNISIAEDGSSRGIYFSLYKLVSRDQVTRVKKLWQ